MSKAKPRAIRMTWPTILILVVVVCVLLYRNRKEKEANLPPKVDPPAVAAGPGEYLFCFWNVENLFDDKDDKRPSIDEPYDDWFATDPKALSLKLNNLTKTLLAMNDGRGPDILAICEVESSRAAELLRDALNESLPAGATPYGEVAMREVSVGRHIAPAVISRLPLSKSTGFSPRRVTMTTVEANGRALVVVASHWTSQVTDTTGDGRDKYGDLIHGRFRGIYRNDAKVDLLVCGDFNDPPESPSVTDNLRATNEIDLVRAGGEAPYLYNLMAGRDPETFGSHRYSGKMLLYDQICVSAGLLDDEGWSCETGSVRTIRDGLVRPGGRVPQPWRFGNQKETTERGFSDHFPVVVKLRVR